MRIFQFVRFASIGLAALCLAGGYAWQSGWLGAGLVLLCGLLWLFGERQEWTWLPALMLVIFFGVAGVGAWLDHPAWLMYLGGVSGLAAWDVAHFTHQQQTIPLNDETQLQYLYLKRLGIVIGVSLLLGVIALTVQLQLNLWWAIGLGLLLIVGLGRMVQTIQVR